MTEGADKQHHPCSMPPRAKKTAAKPAPKTYAGTRSTCPTNNAEQELSGSNPGPESEDNQLDEFIRANIQEIEEIERGWRSSAPLGEIEARPASGQDNPMGGDERPSSAGDSIDLRPMNTGRIIFPPPLERTPNFDRQDSDAREDFLPMDDAPTQSSPIMRAPSSRIAAKMPQPVMPKPPAKTRCKRQPSTPAAPDTPATASLAKQPATKTKAKHAASPLPTTSPISLAQADAAMGNTSSLQPQQPRPHDVLQPEFPSSSAARFGSSNDGEDLVTMSRAELRCMLNKSGDSEMNQFTAHAHRHVLPSEPFALPLRVSGPTMRVHGPAWRRATSSGAPNPTSARTRWATLGATGVSGLLHPPRDSAYSPASSGSVGCFNLSSQPIRSISIIPLLIKNNLKDGLVRMIWLSDITPAKCEAARKGKDLKPVGRIVVADDGTIETKITCEDGSSDALLTATEFIMAGDTLCEAIQRYLKPANMALLLASQLQAHFKQIWCCNNFIDNFQRYRLYHNTVFQALVDDREPLG
ncbi:hypothetical protein C8J57DRAFT_1220914 [Mycena rebaudengoi]|nr:hypothetical protein C8J57DRAFT_1220914 [Mycena rebaudengoi]